MVIIILSKGQEMKKILLVVVLLMGMGAGLSAGEFEENKKACDDGNETACKNYAKISKK